MLEKDRMTFVSTCVACWKAPDESLKHIDLIKSRRLEHNANNRFVARVCLVLIVSWVSWRGVSRRSGICVVSALKKMIEQQKTDTISSTDTTELEVATVEKQRARAFLRERFLRVVTGIVGKQTEYYLHENTRVSGEFRGCDVECSEIFVRNLETPMGKVPEAILRSSDIIYLDIDEIDADIILKEKPCKEEK